MPDFLTTSDRSGLSHCCDWPRHAPAWSCRIHGVNYEGFEVKDCGSWPPFQFGWSARCGHFAGEHRRSVLEAGLSIRANNPACALSAPEAKGGQVAVHQQVPAGHCTKWSKADQISPAEA